MLMPRRKCICVYPTEDGVIVRRCSIREIMKELRRDLREAAITGDIIYGFDSTLRIIRDDGEEFEIEPSQFDEVLSGNEALGKEILRDLREFLRDRKIIALQYYDSEGECCYGTDEYCDFEEMIENAERVVETLRELKRRG